MEPSREIFWNIPFGWIIYPLAAVAIAVLAYGLYQRIRLWRKGKPDRRTDQLGKRVRDFITVGVREGLGHQRMLREPYPGLMHFLLFWGALALLITTALDVIDHYFVHFLQGRPYLGLSLFSDSLGLLFIVGVLVAAFRRYVQKPKRLDNRSQDYIALLLILVVLLSGFVVEGLRLAADELPKNPGWSVWSPGGWMLGQAFEGIDAGTLESAHRAVWWFHSLLVLGAIAYVGFSFTKLSHIVLAPVNLFFRSSRPKGALAPMDLEKAETWGVSKIQEFTWKQLFDLECCTRCGRCQENCPAYLTEKPLSPKKVIQDLKNHLDREAKVLLKEDSSEVALVDQVIKEEELWDCTTCRACQEACPVFIEHVDKIIDLRRYLVMTESRILDPAAVTALKSMEARGHPYRGTMASRTDWAAGLPIKLASEHREFDYLYFVGCSAALDDRNMKVAKALSRVVEAAGVRLAYLGLEEVCCGDPARRMGNEYLYQTMAQKNIETFKNYGVQRMVTACPHCFNTLKNEYPQFGGHFQVLHHSQLMARLLTEGKLRLSRPLEWRITYHDPCYLGRHNNLYSPPRQVLKALPGLHLTEMKRSRNTSFCCGGGGGHMWMEETRGRRINQARTDMVLETKAQVVGLACPFCMSMFEDGIKARGAEENLKARDLAEIVAEAL